MRMFVNIRWGAGLVVKWVDNRRLEGHRLGSEGCEMDGQLRGALVQGRGKGVQRQKQRQSRGVRLEGGSPWQVYTVG